MGLSVVTVDVFCGIGGLTYGLRKAGIHVAAGIDMDESCRYAYETNNYAKFVNADIRKITAREVNKLFGKADVKILVGCAPCQCFSKHTQKIKNRKKDEKWNLLKAFGNLISDVNPDIVSMENVGELKNQGIFKRFVSGLKKKGHHVYWKVIYCPDYGIPQKRSRLVLLASKLGSIELIKKTHTPERYRTVKQIIGDLEKIGAGEESKKDKMHRAAILSATNLKRIKQSKPGGTWLDWKEELRCPCHRKKTGESYSAVYGRMRWNEPGPTITTQFYVYGTGRFGHPEQNRALSFREGALLQTFPKKYKFIKPRTEYATRQLGIHIGNAVPVRLGVIIGSSILKHLEVTKNE
ncbi:MAG: DNA cytosine methyltransferase [Phycisphaerae bacterium]|jgi:DNA (cytosine-5)-methyltransferase 1